MQTENGWSQQYLSFQYNLRKYPKIYWSINVMSIAAAMSQKSCFTACVECRWHQYYISGWFATGLAVSPIGPQSVSNLVNQ